MILITFILRKGIIFLLIVNFDFFCLVSLFGEEFESFGIKIIWKLLKKIIQVYLCFAVFFDLFWKFICVLWCFLICSSRTHYIEYLAKLIHQYKLDPVVIFELNELLQELRRRGKSLPDRSKDASDQLYRDICIKVRRISHKYCL